MLIDLLAQLRKAGIIYKVPHLNVETGVDVKYEPCQNREYQIEFPPFLLQQKRGAGRQRLIPHLLAAITPWIRRNVRRTVRRAPEAAG